MNVFHIIGPVMIGPSSSHTAGAVRIGRVAHKILEGADPAEITVELSGSFAKTYAGHGTDRALLAGIMGFDSDSPEIRDAFAIAERKHIRYEIVPIDIPDTHPNTARISITAKDGKKIIVEGSSIGGGNIRITRINDMKVDFSGENNTLLVLHYDKPGLVAAVTNLMFEEYKTMNIGNFKLTRSFKGGPALMTIEVDGQIPDGLTEDIKHIPNVIHILLIKAI